MPTNSYLPFAIAAGANVWSDATYNGSSQQQTGIQKGIVPSGLMSKAWRQSSVPASALGQVIVDHGLIDAADDGNMLGFKANLRMSLAAMLAGVAFAVDQSTTANVITVLLDPAPPTLTTYRGIFVKIANPITGPATLALNNLGTRGVVKRSGAPLVSGDLLAGQFAHLLFDVSLGQWVLAGMVTSDLLAIIASNQIGIQNPLAAVTTAGTYTYAPSSAKVRAIYVRGQAAGGGGAGSTSTDSTHMSAGCSGGGGAYFEHYVVIANAATYTASYTVGAAGTAGAAGGGAGGNGGTTSFGGVATATGGQGGFSGGSVPTGSYTVTATNAGGAASGGNILNRPGGGSATGFYINSTASVGVAGSSQLGNSDLPYSVAHAGTQGNGYGAGGTGGCSPPSTASAQPGGLGGLGLIQITEIF